MAVTFDIQSPGGIRSTSGENPRAEVAYWGEGSDDHDTVVLAFEAYLNTNLPSFGLLPRTQIDVESSARNDVWDCRAIYSYAQPQNAAPTPEAGDTLYEFDTTGGTANVTHALEHIHDYALPGAGDAPNHGGAINVDADLNIQGTQIIAPAFAWSVPAYYAALAVTNAFKGILFQLTGRVNHAYFRGFQRGECLYLGAVGRLRGTGMWEIQHRFASSPNRVGLVIGKTATSPGVTVASKLGWELVWPECDRVVDTAAQRAVAKLRAVHVERVYEFGDFSLLGIGTT